MTDLIEQGASVNDLLSVMRDMPQYEPETKHIFHGGMYCRSVFRHAGVTIIGRVHKKEHFYCVMSGTIVVTADGKEPERITAPAIITSKPGTRRAVYAETDALCVTFHRIDSSDIAEVEDELVEPEESPIFAPGNVLMHQPREALK